MSTTSQKVKFTLKVKASPIVDHYRLDRITRHLFKEFSQIEHIESMKGIRNPEVPKGARGIDGVSPLIREIMIELSAAGIIAFVQFFFSWLKQQRDKTDEDIAGEITTLDKPIIVSPKMSDKEINAAISAFQRNAEEYMRTEKRFALLVGNSEYDDKNFSTLLKPNTDVQGLAEVLENPNIGNFETQISINESSAIVQEKIAEFYNNRSRDDLLLFYFAGHGMRDDMGRFYLAMKNTKTSLPAGTAIPADFINERINDSFSRRKVILLDSCHSGAFAEGRRGVIGGSVGIKSAFEGNGYGRVVITATDSMQYAWEDAQTTKDAYYSVFTESLINGLHTGEADQDFDGRIDIDELFGYISTEVRKKTPKQTPRKFTYDESGKIFIARNQNLLQRRLTIAKSPSSEPRLILLEKISLTGKMTELINKRKRFFAFWGIAFVVVLGILTFHPALLSFFSAGDENKMPLPISNFNPEGTKGGDYVDKDKFGFPIGRTHQFLTSKGYSMPGYKLELQNFQGIKSNGEKITLSLHREALQNFLAMQNDAAKNRIVLKVLSAYRRLEDQIDFKQRFLQKAAMPGYSEHHLGTTVDFSMKRDDWAHPIYKWLSQNAHHYGFILTNYRNHKMEGIPEEANHWRYVGIEPAKIYYENYQQKYLP